MIWFKKYSVKDLEVVTTRKTLVQLLDIKVFEIGDDYLLARMPVDDRTRQIYGILHGGATCVLVESAGSLASYMCIDPDKQYSVGSSINVNHLRQVRDGTVFANCKPVHIGRQKHVWDIPIYAEDTGKLIAKGELTCFIINEKLKAN